MREFIVSFHTAEGKLICEKLAWGRGRGAALKVAHEHLAKLEAGARFQIEG